MSDTNVRIRLSADGKQVREELKLIDQEMQRIGKTSTSTSGTSTPSSTHGSDTVRDGTVPQSNNSNSNPKQEQRDRIQSLLYRELTQIRKKLQQMRNSSSPMSSSGSTTPSVSQQSSNPSSDPGNGGDKQPTKDNLPVVGNLTKALGKIASAASALKLASSAWNYMSSGAKDSAAGESLAYKTYGSTLAYDDYYDAKKDAYRLGVDYGYDYETVMSAYDSNASKAGFTTLDNYKSDMGSILSTSSGWGIDPNSMASASGYMTSIGVTQSGEQKKFADLLSQSIVQANMTGREDEQLQVLEIIAENLASVNATVSDESLNGSLNMYNALVANNENLKGTRGAEYATTMQDIAASANSSLDVLAGFGTEFTGLAGKQELRRMAETNPDEYWKRVYQGAKENGISDEQFTELIYQSTGSYSKADEIINSLPDLISGENNIVDTSAGEQAVQERNENRNSAHVSTLEQYDLNKQDTKENFGEFINNALSPFRDWFNGLSEGQRGAATAAGGIASGVVGTIGINKLVDKAGSLLKGALSGTGTGAAGAEAAGAAASKSGGFISNILSSLGNSIKGAASGTGAAGAEASGGLSSVLSNVGNSIKGAISGTGSAGSVVADAAEGAGAAASKSGGFISSLLSKVPEGAGGVLKGVGKVAGKAAVPLAIATETIGTVVDVKEHLDQGDERAAAQDVGGGVGGLAGALGGAAAGAAIGSVVPGAGTAIGGIIGAVIGGLGLGLAGDAIGEQVGGAVYDATTGTSDSTTGTPEDKDYSNSPEYYQHWGSVYQSAQENGIDDEQFKELIYQSTGSYSKADTILESLGESGEIDTSKTEDNTDSLELNTEAIIGLTSAISGDSVSFGSMSQSSSSSVSSRSSSTGNKFATGSGNSSTTSGSGSSIISSIASLFSGNGTAHAVGADYIPYDNYQASLHRGEMVLTKFEAEDYRRGKTRNSPNSPNANNSSSGLQGSVELNININGNVDGMTADNQNRIVQAVVSQLNSSNLQSMLSNGFKRVPNY